jgi:hypothetical protein
VETPGLEGVEVETPVIEMEAGDQCDEKLQIEGLEKMERMEGERKEDGQGKTHWQLALLTKAQL